MAERQVIIPQGLEAQYSRFHFAPAMKVGDTVHVSGVIGVGPDGTCAEDPAAQFDQAFANLAHVLAAAGATVADVVELTTFHVGLNQHMRAFMAAKDRVLAEPWPAWTAIGCVELAMPGGIVEIRATAVVS